MPPGDELWHELAKPVSSCVSLSVCVCELVSLSVCVCVWVGVYVCVCVREVCSLGLG